MGRLSPICQLAKTQGLNLNPKVQNSLLKYAVNKPQPQDDKDETLSDEDEQMDVGKFESKKKL